MQKIWGYSCDALYWNQIIGLQNTYKDIKRVETNLPITIKNPVKAETLLPDSMSFRCSDPKTNVIFKHSYGRLISWY